MNYRVAYIDTQRNATRRIELNFLLAARRQKNALLGGAALFLPRPKKGMRQVLIYLILNF